VTTPDQLRALWQDFRRRLDEIRTVGRPDEDFGGGAATVAEYIARLEQAIRTLDIISRERGANRTAGPWAWWRPEHFRPGDDALILGCWYPVVRVDRWSLTVSPLVLLGSRRLDQRGEDEWTDIVSFDAVYGRRRNGYGVRHPRHAAEGLCTEPLDPQPHDRPCGSNPVARLTIHHDGTFCGCDWLCRLDRYVVDRGLEPWTERRWLCHTHLAEHHQLDPALHQPPVRVLEHLPPPGGNTPSVGEQPGAGHGQTRHAEPRTEGDQP
jgi:hypothetical protein